MDYVWHVIIALSVSLPNILGYNLVLGRGKIFHFGPLGISIVAAYGTFLPLLAGVGYPLSLLCGLVAAVLVSLLFAWLSLRLDPDGLGVMSIAVHLAFISITLNWQSLTRGALGLPRIPRFPFLEPMAQVLSLSAIQAFALLSFTVCAAWCVVVWWIDRGPFGRSLQALAEHPWHASSLGVSRARVHVIVFALSAVGALIANVLFHQYIGLVHYSDFGFPAFIFFLMVVVAGRPGSVRGCILAAILLTLLREGLRFLPLPYDLIGPVRLIVFGLILFAAVWWRRDVLFPAQRSI